MSLTTFRHGETPNNLERVCGKALSRLGKGEFIMSDLGLQRVGPTIGGSGTAAPFRADTTGAQMVGDAHGRYAEAARRQRVFGAASQAATTWSVALNTTHTGFVVYNPIASGVNLEILQASFALSVAPVAIAHMGLFGGFLAAGITTHTTALSPFATVMGAAAGMGKADGAATLVGSPIWLMPFLGGFTAGALFGTSPSIMDIGGSIIVPPGGYCGIGALTAVIGFAGMFWEEVPIIA